MYSLVKQQIALSCDIGKSDNKHRRVAEKKARMHEEVWELERKHLDANNTDAPTDPGCVTDYNLRISLERCWHNDVPQENWKL